jgi:hypothetical protein
MTYKLSNIGDVYMPEKRSSRSDSEGSERSREDVFKQGQTPGPGEYKCVSCNEDWRVTLKEEKSRLPPCGKCGPGVTAEYERIGSVEGERGSKSGARSRS